MQAIFDFSGIKISLSAQFDFQISPELARFESDCQTADVYVSVRLAPEDKNTGDDTRCSLEVSGNLRCVYVPESRKNETDGALMLRVADIYHMLLSNGAVVIHASYILYRGAAILFSAPSGTGKSTQAELWNIVTGAQIVNGDRAIIRKTDKGFVAGGIYYCGTSGICENVTAPLRAVVMLGQAQENSLRRLRGRDAFTQLLRQVAYRKSPECAAELVAQIAAGTPVYRLDCRPDANAVSLLHAELFGDEFTGGN